MALSKKSARFELRLTEDEKQALKEKSKSIGMSQADYLRSLLASEDGTLSIVDVSPIADCLYEVRAHGRNLNQLQRHLNTYGSDAFFPGLEKRVKSVIEAERDAFLLVRDTLASLREKVELGSVHILEKLPNEEEL